MRLLTTLSVCLLVAAAALFIASRPSRDEHRIDRSFLTVLASMPTTPDASTELGETYSRLCWENFDELVYFGRKGDPLAVSAIQRLILNGGMPGGCSCSKYEFREAFYDEVTLPQTFVDLLPTYTPAQQAELLLDADDAQERIGFGCGVCWLDLRDEYLEAHPAAAASYQAAIARRIQENADAGHDLD